MGAGDIPRDGEAKPRSARGQRREGPEGFLPLGRRNPRPVIIHRDLRPAARGARRQDLARHLRDADRDPPRMLARIVEQIRQASP